MKVTYVLSIVTLSFYSNIQVAWKGRRSAQSRMVGCLVRFQDVVVLRDVASGMVAANGPSCRFKHVETRSAVVDCGR